MKLKYIFAVLWFVLKENSSYCVLNFGPVWNIFLKVYKQLYTCLFLFMAFFFNSFGSRSEQPHVQQLLIKMLILGQCLMMWEGLVLLCQIRTSWQYKARSFWLKLNWDSNSQQETQPTRYIIYVVKEVLLGRCNEWVMLFSKWGPLWFFR